MSMGEFAELDGAYDAPKKPRKAKKPAADRHPVEHAPPTVVEYIPPQTGLECLAGAVAELPMRDLLEHQKNVAALVISKRNSRMAELKEEMTMLGAPKPKWQGHGKHPSKGKKLPPMYRDEHGNTWAGRGMKPKWLKDALDAGHSLGDFLV